MKKRKFMLYCMLYLGLLASTAAGRNPSRGFDPASDYFWKQCNVACVEVSAITTSVDGKTIIDLKTTERYAGDIGDVTRVDLQSLIWLGVNSGMVPDAAPVVKKGDLLLVVNDPRLGGFTTVRVADHKELVADLATIRSLRGSPPKMEVLLDYATKGDQVVSNYALSQFAAQAKDADIRGNADSLQKIRDSRDKMLSTCIGASRILRTQGKAAADSNYQWAQAILLDPGKDRLGQLVQVVTYIESFEDRRQDTVALSIAAIRRKELPREVRTAAMGVLDQPSMFELSKPFDDARTKAAIDFLLESVSKESDSGFRRDAAFILFKFVGEVGDASQQVKLRSTVIDTFDQQLRSEGDQTCRVFLKDYLDQLKNVVPGGDK